MNVSRKIDTHLVTQLLYLPFAEYIWITRWNCCTDITISCTLSACSVFTWPFVTEWWLALCGITVALILLSLFCTVCTTLNVVNTYITSLPYMNEDLWKVVFAYARRKPLYAVMARSYRRTCRIVNTFILTPFTTEYRHLRLIISCEPPFGANKLHVLLTQSTQWNWSHATC
jgi:hypothetical protein